MAKKKNKIFVLDTNVILHDSECLYQFDEHDIVIPIMVIEELDNFKRGRETVNRHAREFLRGIDKLFGDKPVCNGVKIREGSGKITIAVHGFIHDYIQKSFHQGKVDHQILNMAYCIAELESFDRTILVTKDINLRMKAKAVGLKAEDYTSDRVDNLDQFYKGYRVIDNVPPAMVNQLHQPPFEMEMGMDLTDTPPLDNEFFVLKNGSLSVLGSYEVKSNLVRKIENRTCAGVKAKNAEQAFAIDALLDKDIPLVTITGKAGTGKTLLALAAALEQKKHFRQIFLARPVVPLSNKDIGFLPGDIKSKLDPYMQPLFDNLSVIAGLPAEAHKKIDTKELLESEKIVIAPLSYIRGRSLVKIFFIVDEAQNLTPHEVKTIVTRAGEGTKIIFTGDIFQIDHPYLDSRTNGLSYLIDRMKDHKLYAHINLEKGERSKLSDLAAEVL